MTEQITARYTSGGSWYTHSPDGDELFGDELRVNGEPVEVDVPQTIIHLPCDEIVETGDGIDVTVYSTLREDVRELAERWRYEDEQAAGSGGYKTVAEAYEQCADELEELIEDD